MRHAVHLSGHPFLTYKYVVLKMVLKVWARVRAQGGYFAEEHVQKVAAGNAAAAALIAAGKPKPAWTTAEGRPTAGDIVRITSSVNDLLVEDICNVLKDTTDGAPYTLAKIGGPKVEVQPTSPVVTCFSPRFFMGPFVRRENTSRSMGFYLGIWRRWRLGMLPPQRSWLARPRSK